MSAHPTAATELRATTPADLPAIQRFLQRIFAADESAPFIQAHQLHWKYWHPREDWPQPRSFVLERGTEVLAHACLWPLELKTERGIVRANAVIDWAADPTSLGSGIRIMKHMMQFSPVTFSVGGSESTLRILPALGFRHFCDFTRYARPVRPLLQMWQHQYRGYKSVPRFIRNLAWSLLARRARGNDWVAQRVASDAICPSFFQTNILTGAVVSQRSPQWAKYVSLCFTAEHAFYRLSKKNLASGYGCVSYTPGQARIADFYVNSADEETRADALESLTREAASDTRIAEVVGISAAKDANNAFRRCGYKSAGTFPLLIYDPQNHLRQDAWEIQLLDNDLSYLHRGFPEFWT